MPGNKGRAPKSIDLSKLFDKNTAMGRLDKQMKIREDLVEARFLRAALGPTDAIKNIMEPHRNAIYAERVLSDVSAITGIVDAARLANSYRLPDIAGQRLMEAYKLPEITGIEAVSSAHRRIMDSFRFGSLADMIGSQAALTALAPSFGLMKTDVFAGLLEGIRLRQSALASAIDAYMDHQRVQVERTTGLMKALAMPRIDPTSFGIGSALALGETNAFRIAGLGPDYAEQYRSIFSAVNARISAVSGLGALESAFTLQQDLLGGVGSLLERALAQQEALLEQQRQQVEKAENEEPKTPSRLVQQLNILASIVVILHFFIAIALQIEERTLGGDPATLNNTAAVEENTQAIEQMRDSFDVLASQLERMRDEQDEAREEEKAANAAIAAILREIADTLADQVEDEEERR